MSASPNDAASLIGIKVPDIGDFDEVTVIELLVKPGDSIQADQSLINQSKTRLHHRQNGRMQLLIK